MTAEASRRIWAVAHRGASADRPENTLAAFDEALRQGADGIELDLQLTRDGVPVVYHDRTLRRAGGGWRGVGSRTLEELRLLDAGAWFGEEYRGERIPTLDEVLDRVGSPTLLLLEVKRRGSEAERARMVRTLADRLRGLEDRVLLLSFDAGVLAESERVAPRLRRVLNLEPRGALATGVRELVPRLFAVSADVRGIDDAFLGSLHGPGARLLTYTCNTRAEVARSVSAGACGVMSDRPAWLVERLHPADGMP